MYHFIANFLILINCLVINVHGESTYVNESIQLVEIKSIFDMRNNRIAEAAEIATCIVNGYDTNYSVSFQVGDQMYPETVVGDKHVLKIDVTKSVDKSWVSCLVSTRNYTLTSSTTFKLTLLYYPTMMNIKIVNGYKFENKWFIPSEKSFMIRCKTDGNPKPRVQIRVNSVLQTRNILRAYPEAFNQTSEIVCSSNQFNLTRRETFSISSMKKPFVKVSHGTQGQIHYTCVCNGYPKPDVTWVKAPRLKKEMLSSVIRQGSASRKGFRRKLWNSKIISKNETLTFADIEELRQVPELIFLCNCVNLFNSQVLAVHKIKTLFDKSRQHLNIWSTKECGLPRQNVKPKICTDDVCQVKTTKGNNGYCIECQQPNTAVSNNVEDRQKLSIIIDGKAIEALPSNTTGKIFASLSLPLKKEELLTRVTRDGRNHQKSCMHKITCRQGENDIETMKIIANYLRAPVIGIKRHKSYKVLRRPIKISKPVNTEIEIKCMSDSIPTSSILWVRNNHIISRTNYLRIANAQLSDNGKYYCYAANSVGLKSSEIKLRLH